MLRRVKLFLGIILLIFVIYNVYNFFNIVINKKVFKSPDVPKEFDGFRIIQISDFHNKKFHRRDFFIKSVITQRPDVVFITGDFVDSRNPDFKYALNVIKELASVTKIYYVLGNHEGRLKGIDKFLDDCTELGVVVLRQQSEIIRIGDSLINIVGVDDTSITSIWTIREVLKEKFLNGHLNILLSHRPEIFDEYVNAGYDLIFSGHTHGGQVRIPLLGAIFAPNQGVLPAYDKGAFTKKDSTMIVSSGIGTSVVPIRIFNKPELVLVELKYEK